MNIQLKAFVFALSALLFFSCSSNPNTPSPSQKIDFKKDFTANYDISVVDTNGNGNGHHADSILAEGRISVTDIVIDTAAQWKGKTNVVQVKTYQGTQVTDSQYFYQDPNGDLWRYNFGFSILNEFPYLVSAVGATIDVGWVLAAKMNSGAGTKWTARVDSVYIQAYNIWVYLISTGEMMADTTFTIGTASVKARHSQNIVSASAGTPPFSQTGDAIIDSYYSLDINAVVEDYYRHATLKGALTNQQAQGKFKIMTSHK